MTGPNYHSRGYRMWDIQLGVALWCSATSGWYVVFATGPGSVAGQFTWRVTRAQARVLFGLID